MNLYNQILGIPWIYENVRPLATGGLDLRPAYEIPNGVAGEVVLDVGCGTGDALEYLEGYEEYHGFDLDDRAITHLKRKRMGEKIHAYSRSVSQSDVDRIKPSVAFMIGVIHHLSDLEALRLFNVLETNSHIQTVRTLDVQFIEGRLLNNLFVSADRGKHVRTFQEHEALIARCPFQIANTFTFEPRIPIVSYQVMDLIPRG